MKEKFADLTTVHRDLRPTRRQNHFQWLSLRIPRSPATMIGAFRPRGSQGATGELAPTGTGACSQIADPRNETGAAHLSVGGPGKGKHVDDGVHSLADMFGIRLFVILAATLAYSVMLVKVGVEASAVTAVLAIAAGIVQRRRDDDGAAGGRSRAPRRKR